MTEKKGSLLSIIDKTIQLGGAVFEKCFNLSIDGFRDLMFSTIDYGADLTNINRMKIIDFLMMLNMRRTLAASIYPVLEIEKNIKNNPNEYKYKIDYVEQLDRQAIFLMKIAEWTALSPFHRKVVDRLYRSVYEAREEVGLNKVYLNEIKIILAQLTIDIDVALDEENEEIYKKLLSEYIRCQIIVNDSENVIDYLEILKIYDVNSYDFLFGKYLLSNEEYEIALIHLEKACNSEVPYAKELAAHCIDELIKRNIDIEKYLKIKRKIIGSDFSREKAILIKNIPMTFVLVKWSEICKVYQNLTNVEKGDRSA